MKFNSQQTQCLMTELKKKQIKKRPKKYLE
jgi:hypothetical protein